MAVMTTEVLGLPRGRALTRDDLDAMPDDGHRYELLDGALIVSPAPRVIHQEVSANLFALMRPACPAEFRLLYAPVDVVLGSDTVIQPDLLVAPRAVFTERELPVAPLIAVEILSPTTRSIDLLLKKDRLCRAGCEHYWVVDPDELSVTAWALRNGEYELQGKAVGAEELALVEPFAITIVPAALIG